MIGPRDGWRRVGAGAVPAPGPAIADESGALVEPNEPGGLGESDESAALVEPNLPAGVGESNEPGGLGGTADAEGFEPKGLTSLAIAAAASCSIHETLGAPVADMKPGPVAADNALMTRASVGPGDAHPKTTVIRTSVRAAIPKPERTPRSTSSRGALAKAAADPSSSLSRPAPPSTLARSAIEAGTRRAPLRSTDKRPPSTGTDFAGAPRRRSDMKTTWDSLDAERAVSLARAALLRPLSPFDRLPPRLVVVDVTRQRLSLVREGAVVGEWPVSTARAGVGGEDGSNRTPPGWHRVHARIGDGTPRGTVFESRTPTGAVWQGELIADDLILTRVVTLEGLEDGVNRGPGRDSLARYIYLHGTNHENEIGRPASHGCVRMRNDDVLALFENVQDGDPVVVVEGTLGALA